MNLNEEENSLIIWDHGYSDDGNDSNVLNIETIAMNEDFIEVDITPESNSSLSDDEDEGLPNNDVELFNGPDSPIFNEHYNIGAEYMDFETPSIVVDNIDSNTVSETWREKCSNVNEEPQSSYEMPITEQFPTNTDDYQDKREEFCSELLDVDFELVLNYCESLPKSCYVEGLVCILHLFGCLESSLESLTQVCGECECQRPSTSTSWSQLLLEVNGSHCAVCSIENILLRLNNSWLRDKAEVCFYLATDILYPGSVDSHNKIDHPRPGWFRAWVSRHFSSTKTAPVNCLISVVYADSRDSRGIRNTVAVARLIRGYDETGFFLSSPAEHVGDSELEQQLLAEDSVLVPKSLVAQTAQTVGDFERLCSHADKRFRDMNVLGQVVATFREKASDTFTGFLPEVHHVRVPSLHGRGVLLANRCCPL